jgi:phosphate transport system substrate-binding protein
MREKGHSSAGWPKFVSNPVLIATMLLVVCFAEAQQLSVRGSDTLIFLGQRFDAIYSRTSPETRIAVQGGGWTEAVNALSAGQADIAQIEGEPPATASRDFVSFPIGVQSIVVYVNESNPIRELTIGQLRSIFMGEITNWKTLGGPDANIVLYAGESTTGTLAYFQESVLRKQEPYPFVGKSNTKELLVQIASDRESIGYGSLASAPGTRALAIKFGSTSLAIQPSEGTIRSRQYPVTRHISWVVRHQRNQAVDSLCRWALSSEGQLVVEASGFEPLLPNERRTALAKLGGPTIVKPADFNPASHGAGFLPRILSRN